MGWRTLIISNPANLSIDHKQLKILQKGTTYTVPVEDIRTLLLESNQTRLSGAVLSVLAAKGVCVIVCGANHQPNGVLHGFGNHSRTTELLQLQLDIRQPLKKQCWKKVVQAKIVNQATVLKPYQADKANALLKMAESVQSGDPTNREAAAARLYWQALFGSGFTRQHDNSDIFNSALNYGYAIVRASCARAITAHGLQPALGIHHNNQLNAFNLADDLMEPCRPFVDKCVRNLALAGESLTPTIKQQLVAVMLQDSFINQQCHQLENAVEFMVESIIQAFRERKAGLLKLPMLKDAD